MEPPDELEWDKLVKELSPDERREMLDRLCMMADAIIQMDPDAFCPDAKRCPPQCEWPAYQPPSGPGLN